MMSCIQYTKAKPFLQRIFTKNIHTSGKNRGKTFESKVKDFSRIEYADCKSFEFNNTLI